MMVRCALLLFAAVSLAGCCLSGTACYGPTMAAGGPPAWDGLGAAPPDDDSPAAETTPLKKPARVRSNRAASVDPSSGSANSYISNDDTFEQQQAADRADDARLKQKMIICQNCAATGPVNNDVLGSSR
ncbi:hypothetical protein [Bradyrhizobium sp.]|uniref:hypothetical protein n=1 Tax=Bradyrhizobium sp. TaxID=376 RepID=UPI003C608CD1